MPEVKVSLLDPSIKVISSSGKNPVTIEANAVSLYFMD
jgi:hypothetical protein